MFQTSIVQGKSMTPAQQALSKSVHFTLGSSILPSKIDPQQQQQIQELQQPNLTQVTAIDCIEHLKPLKGFCIEPDCFNGKRKLCLSCLWDHRCVHKLQQPDFVKVLQDKIHIAGPNFFDHLQKILKKDHLQEEIDQMFLRVRQEFDTYLNTLYSQFMWWSKHGMGEHLGGNQLVQQLLFDERIIDEMQDLVLKGRPMEAGSDTINVCVELINSDAQILSSLPEHLKIALEQSEIVIRQTLKNLEDALDQFKSHHFEFQNIPAEINVPQLRIPGIQGQLSSLAMNFSRVPQTQFIQNPSQIPQNQSGVVSTSYHQRFHSTLAQNISPKLFSDARDLHQSQVWALCKVNSQVIASGDWQGNIKIISITPDGQYQFMQALNHGKTVYALTMANGRENIILSAGQNMKEEWTIKIWDLERAAMLRELKGHMNYIFSIVMPNPNQIVSCSYDETIRVWDYDNGSNIRIFREYKTSFNDLCVWSIDEIIACSDDKAIRMVNINTGQLKMQVFDSCFVNGLARVSKTEIAVGNFKGEIVIINVPESKITRRMGSHKNFVWRIKVKSVLDSELIASASFDKTVKIWEWKSGSLVASLEGHTEIVRALDLLEENYLLVSGSDDRSLKIWRLI